MLIFKLNGWEYNLKHIKTGQRPGVVGKWTKKYVYSALPHGVLNTLLKLTGRREDGSLKNKLFQHLTEDEGISSLEDQIDKVILLMEVSDNWKDFEKLWNKKFGQQQLSLDITKLFDPKKDDKLSKFNQKLLKAVKTNPKDDKE